MSAIEDRVVSMKFDNKNFESNVQTSISTLDKLKRALKMDGAAKGLSDLEAKSKGINLDSISNGVQSLNSKFSALSIAGVAALASIATKAVDTGIQLAKSLSIKPIMAGFQEYETQMNAVQTILANTSHKGTNLKQVNGALDELNTYADKTIYNFTEMTRNIGTFTAAGLGLKESTSAIKGIANLAAVSGSNSQQASTAMYQLSQALSSGTVKLQDWNSVVNAGMGGKVFQDALLRTAKVHGKSVDSIIKGETSFRESLQKGWLTSEVLAETLNTFTGDLNAKQLKAMGYNEQQIAGILKMGKTASDAATKVKTFTQLIDTLNEAQQSGWTKTWQLLLGDFEQAKELFTGISDVVGGVINRMADARNNLIEGWAKAGGRMMLLEGLKNVFNGLAQVMKPIQEAFREIFPPTTVAQLMNLTKGFLEFTKGMRISYNTAQRIKDTFKGVFAIFSIAKTIITAVAKAFFNLFSGFGEGRSNILTFTSMIGRNIAAFDKWLKSGEGIEKYLMNFSNRIKNVIGLLKSFKFPVSFKQLAGDIEGALRILFTGDYKGGLMSVDEDSKVVDYLFRIRENLGSIANFVRGVGSILFYGDFTGGIFGLDEDSKVVDFLFKIREGFMKIPQVATKAWNGLKKIFDGIKNGFKKAFAGADINDLLTGLAVGGIAGFGIAIKKIFDNFGGIGKESKGVVKQLKETLGSIQGVFDGLTGRFEAMQQNLKAGALLKIAGAIAIMAASLIALSMVDRARLEQAVIGLGAATVGLIAAMKQLEDSFGETGAVKVAALGIAMIGLGVGISFMATGIAKMAGLDWNGIAKGLTGLVGLLGALAGFLRIGKFDTMGVKAGVALGGLGLSLLIFAVAMEKFGKLDMGTIGKGLAAISGVLLAVGAFTRLNNPTKMISLGVGMNALAASLLIFHEAVKRFAGFSWGDLGKGLAGMAGALGGVAVAMAIMPKDSLAKSIALVAVGKALEMIGGVVKSMGEMSWGDIAKGLATLAGSLTILGVAMYAMSGSLLGAAAMLIVAPALLALGKTMKTLGGMSWGDIAKGLTALAGAMTILAVGLTAMIVALPGALALLTVAPALGALALVMTGLGGMSWGDIAKSLTVLSGALLVLAIGLTAMIAALPGAAALVVASAALGVLSGVLMAMGKMSWGEIAKSLVLLAGALTILGIAGVALIPAIPGLIGLAGALVLVGAAIALAGVGILALSVGLTGLATAFAVNGAVITNAIKALLALIPFAFTQLANGVVAFATRIAQAAGPFMAAASTALRAIITAIGVNTPLIVATLVRMVVSFANTIANNVGKLVDAGFKLIKGILTGIRNNIGQIIPLGADIIVKFLNGISQQMPRIADAGAKAVISFVRSVAAAIRNNQAAMRSAAKELGSAIISGITGGLTDGLQSVVSKASSIAKSALSAAKGVLGINSPSKEFMKVGRGIGEGLVMGMDQMGSQVFKSGGVIASEALKAANALDLGQEIADDIHTEPVITPVVDLSMARMGAMALNKMLDGPMGVTPSLNSIRDPRYIPVRPESDSRNTASGREAVNFNYTQNNYSPKPLSRLDIYRSTQAQLATVRGALGK